MSSGNSVSPASAEQLNYRGTVYHVDVVTEEIVSQYELSQLEATERRLQNQKSATEQTSPSAKNTPPQRTVYIPDNSILVYLNKTPEDIGELKSQLQNHTPGKCEVILLNDSPVYFESELAVLRDFFSIVYVKNNRQLGEEESLQRGARIARGKKVWQFKHNNLVPLKYQ